MKENEELKRCVTAQKLAQQQKQSSLHARSTETQPVSFVFYNFQINKMEVFEGKFKISF